MRFPVNLSRVVYEMYIFSNSVSKTGGNEIAVQSNGKCIFIEKTQTVIDSDSKKTVSSAYLIIKGDIAPDLAVISHGNAIVNGGKYEIIACDRIRDAKGSVFSTEVFLK